MRVFVSLMDAMGCVNLVGVSATQEAAQQILDKVTFGADRRVIELQVLGAQPGQTAVYTAETYEPVLDIYCFEGVYGNDKVARSAAGEKGLVKRQSL